MPGQLKKPLIGEGRQVGRSKETDETRVKLSKFNEEFSGLKKTSEGKMFGHPGRILTPAQRTPFRGLEEIATSFLS